MNQPQEQKKDKIREFLDSLPELTPEQEAMLDEHGDWIVTPEN